MKKTKKQKILIMGIPFAGKTYLSKYFRKDGLNAFDSDYISGLSRWPDKYGHDHTKAMMHGRYSGKPAANRYWKLHTLKGFLDRQRKSVFIFGWAANVEQSKSLFDKVYYLGLTQKQLEKRFTHNEREHDFGTKPQHKKLVKKLHKIGIKKYRRPDSMFINALDAPSKIEKRLLKDIL